MDANDVLNFLKNAASAGAIGVPITQPPRYMGEEFPFLAERRKETYIPDDNIMSLYPRGDYIKKDRNAGLPYAAALFDEIQKMKSSDVSNRYTKAREQDEGPQYPSDIARVLRDILQRDTGRSAQ